LAEARRSVNTILQKTAWVRSFISYVSTFLILQIMEV
jgi:hypothetical protein